jgi:hypothetical protein
MTIRDHICGYLVGVWLKIAWPSAHLTPASAGTVAVLTLKGWLPDLGCQIRKPRPFFQRLWRTLRGKHQAIHDMSFSNEQLELLKGNEQIFSAAELVSPKVCRQ